MKPPRSKLRGITRKGIVCETPRFLTLFPLQGKAISGKDLAMFSPFAIEKLRKLNFREALGKPGAKPFRQ
jgi:hypothetical protein